MDLPLFFAYVSVSSMCGQTKSWFGEKPGGSSRIKRAEAARWEFLKEPLRGTKIPFYGRGLKCFSPLRGTNSNTTHLKLNVMSCEFPV